MTVVCGPADAAAIAIQDPGLPTANIIIEPAPEGTAPALTLASVLIARLDPYAVTGSFAADHVVGDVAVFTGAVQMAIAVARKGDMVTLGLTPTKTETGFGYIERTKDLVVNGVPGTAYRAARFVETPDTSKAVEYVASGRFLWNAGISLWAEEVFRRELLHHLLPQFAERVMRIADAWDTPERETFTAAVRSSFLAAALDHGAMEHVKGVAVFQSTLGWSDWYGSSELCEQDAVGNRVRSEMVQVDTSNSVIPRSRGEWSSLWAGEIMSLSILRRRSW